MSGFKRLLMYEANTNSQFADYGEIVTIINEKLVNVNIGGEKDANGDLVVLEAVAVLGDYVPKLGDWVTIDWRNGQPVAIGGDSNGVSNGLSNINEQVKIIAQTDVASGVINADHIRAGSIEAIHISAQAIEAQHISGGTITGDKIAANTITGTNISGSTITGDKIAANTISGNNIAANTIDAGKLTISARTQGLLAQYFTHTNGINKFETFKGSSIETVLEKDWASGSPSIVGQSDNFAVRYQGLIFSPEAGSITFTLDADSGAKLWIDNILVCDASAGGVVNGSVSLSQNAWYMIRIDYFETTGNAKFSLKWKLPSSGVATTIPSQYLTQSQTVIDGGTILTNTITASAIKVGTITAESGVIADAAIQNANIANGAITSAKIGNAEIKTANIASGNITNALIQDATITSAKINEIDAGKIKTGFLDAARIAAGTIIASMISGGTITGDKIAANTIDSNNIKAGAITATKIAAGSITGDRIAAETITSTNILAGTISSEHISTRGLDANLVNVYNSQTGQVLIGGGYVRVDGLDVGVVQSDNLVGNGLFLAPSSSFGMKRDNEAGEAILGSTSNLPGAHEIWKYNAASGDKVATLAIPSKKPVDLAMDVDGTFAYAIVQGDNTFVQIDLENFVLTGESLNMGMSPSAIMYTGDLLEDMKHFFVLNSSEHHIPNSLIVVDAPPTSVDTDLYVHHWIELGLNPYDMVMGSDKLLYVTQAGQGDIAIIDMSDHNSKKWKVTGHIPIAAYMTDNYHGGLPGFYGLTWAVGGSASSAYDTEGGGTGMEDMGGMAGHNHGGYGNPTGSMKQYEPHGIALSTDPEHLYVCDFENNELLVVDRFGKAPYNDLTGLHTEGNMGEGMPMPSGGTMGGMDGMAMGNSPADAMFMDGGGPTTNYVRYRIPIGNSPDFVKVAGGKVFVTLQGSGKIAVIDEQDILDEIIADRAFYGEDGSLWGENPFRPMRDLPTFTIRTIDVGSKPSKIVEGDTGYLYAVITGQNRIAQVDIVNETVNYADTGPNPRGICFSNDKAFFYVTNYGGSGDFSFVYPSGNYIGDAFIGLEGGISLNGAEHWVPDRSNWVYDASGNVRSYSTIEFRINEPFMNEGGYVKMSLIGSDYQYTQIEQDIYTVVNHSNGNNLVISTDEKLALLDTGNTTFQPRNPWLNSPTPSFSLHVPQSGGSGYDIVTPSAGTYAITYGDAAKVVFSGGVVPSGGYVTATYTARNNLYFKPHNGSALIAIENGSSENFATVFEIDELVPKYVVFDNQQTASFTPTGNGINETYTGLEYSLMTNRAVGKTVTSSAAPISGNLSYVTDGLQVSSEHGDMTTMDMFDPQPYVTLPSGLQYVTVDLGAKYMIGQIIVSHMYEDYDRVYHNTKTQVSEDGVTWTTVYDSAVSGEYNELPMYHPVHGHTHYGKVINISARPVRYIRDYANGWTSGDGTTSGSENHWTEIFAYGDWEVEEGFLYPEGSELAGQQMATNGKCVVTTDIQDAYVAYDMQIEFTSWWYMTYLVGPQFGRLKVEMPSLGGDHYLSLDAPYLNKIAHRHVMPWTPSQNIKANTTTGVKAGKHRAVIRQVSGKISIDRFRIEDFQFYAKNSLLVQDQNIANFTREKIVAEQAKWYEGMGIQSTEGAYDTPRLNPDTKLPDKSVAIKYRFRVKSELNADGSTQERGIAYVTSAIFETGKLHTTWRRSESIDSIPSNKIQLWDANQPHSTGIQSGHIANGAVTGLKIIPYAIMDYHVSPYAKIDEKKLALKYPTHQHGRYVMTPGAGPMGMTIPIFHSNKDFLDSLEGFAGTGGVYGSGNFVARADHTHEEILQASHSHDNKAILDLITGTAVAPAVYNLDNLHTHANKSILDLFSVSTGNVLLWSGGTITSSGGGGGVGLSGGAVLTAHIRLADGSVTTDSGYGIIMEQIRDGAVTNAKIASVDGSKISGNVNLGTGKITTGSGSLFSGNVTISGDGKLWLGATNSAGQLVVRTSGGVSAIQLDGANSGKLSNVSTYIDGSGNAQFAAIVSANTIRVASTGLVANLNAEMLNGLKESAFAKNASILEITGYGVISGFSTSQQTVPNMTVQVSGGTVYTDSGRRFVIATQSIALTSASATYGRYDVVYVRGSSAGANEGNVTVATGTPAASPVEPAIPSDAVKLATVFVGQNVGSILDANITDARKWRSLVFDGSSFTLNGQVNIQTNGGLTSTSASVPVLKPFKATGWATSLTIPSGGASVTWAHNLGLGNYAVTYSVNSPNRHVYWSGKSGNSIILNIDDVTDVPVTIDAVITAY